MENGDFEQLSQPLHFTEKLHKQGSRDQETDEQSPFMTLANFSNANSLNKLNTDILDDAPAGLTAVQ